MQATMYNYAGWGNYVQSLCDYAVQIDDVTPLEELRDSLFVKIQAGQGKELIHSSPGGKSFTFEVTATIQDLFAAVVQAIKLFNAGAGDGPITYIDFSRAGSTGSGFGSGFG